MWGRKTFFAVAFFLLSPFEQACSRVVLAFCLCQKKANTTREHARFRGDRKSEATALEAPALLAFCSCEAHLVA